VAGGSASTSPRIVGVTGGCEPYQIFAQNRFDPVGTAIRVQPNILSDQNGSFAPNKSISVNAWVHSRSAYPTNPAPWNSDIWFHPADGAGWVAFAGVRAWPTAPDPTDSAEDGGPAAPTPAGCEGGIQ
jgi:hypothetical protein